MASPYSCYLFDRKMLVTRSDAHEFADDADAMRWADDQFIRGECYAIVEVSHKDRLVHRRQR